MYNMSLVPHASKPRLYEAVAELNVPYLDTSNRTHPVSVLRALLEAEHEPILKWGSDVSGNLSLGFGGTQVRPTPEAFAFDNAFIAAYGLVRVGYLETGRRIPGTSKPPEWYTWIREDPKQTIPELFKVLNVRQHKVVDEYRVLVDALQTWASDRIPGHNQNPNSIGVVAIAAAEMYYAFERTEEITSLEGMFSVE